MSHLNQPIESSSSECCPLRLKGAILSQHALKSKEFRAYLENEILKWTFLRFNEEINLIEYDLVINQGGTRHFYYGELEIHINGIVYRSSELSSSMKSVVKKCLRKLKKISNEPIDHLFLYDTEIGEAS